MGTPQFRMLCTSSMPSGTVTILSLLSGPGYTISSSGFLSSHVPDSELQASVFHTLDVETDGWDGCHCCVQHHAWSILRHQDSPSRSSSPSRGVCAKRDSYVCGMPAGHDKVEHRVCVQRVLVYSAKVAMFNDPFWFHNCRSSTLSTVSAIC